MSKGALGHVETSRAVLSDAFSATLRGSTAVASATAINRLTRVTWVSPRLYAATHDEEEGQVIPVPKRS